MVFDLKKLETGSIMSRAFKPMPIVLDLVYENFSIYKNLIFFMGKSGKKIFEKSIIILKENFRQSSDKEYIDILMRIRKGNYNEKDIDVLKTRLLKRNTCDDVTKHVHLVSSNWKAQQINNRYLRFPSLELS